MPEAAHKVWIVEKGGVELRSPQGLPVQYRVHTLQNKMDYMPDSLHIVARKNKNIQNDQEDKITQDYFKKWHKYRNRKDPTKKEK